MDIKEIQQAVADEARACGAEGYEISISSEESAGAEALKHEISSVSYSCSGTMHVRCVKNGKSGYASSELITPEAAAKLVEQACDNALAIDEEDSLGLFAGSAHYEKSPDVARELPDADEMKAETMELQEMTYAASSKIVEGTQCGVTGTKVSLAMCNSQGLNLSYDCSLVYRLVAAAVMDGEDAADAYRIRELSREEPASTVQKAVEEALSKLGAEAVESGKYPIIMEPGAFCSLLSTYSSVFSARSAYMKTTLLAGKEGQMVASPVFSLIDDPFHPEKFLHCPFDGEGVAVYRKNVIEKGELKTLLYNRMYAKLLGRETTGNAADAKHIEPKGLYVAPGTFTKEALLEKLDSGLLITDLNGLHAGANVQSGDFSLQAEGFLIEKGRKVRAVKNITIADNFFQLMKKAEALGAQVEFATGSSYGAPQILFTDISVSGK